MKEGKVARKREENGTKGKQEKSARSGKGEASKVESMKSRNGNTETKQEDDMEFNKVT